MSLTKNILQTIIYYDILDFPLTTFEIWKYLIAEKKYGLGEIIDALECDEVKKHIEEFRGFYFVRGRKNLVARRIQNEKNSIEKHKIAEKVARWLRFAPFVRMVAMTGTLAMKNCEKDSDIDFFVVLEKGRIFTGRLLVTLTAYFLGRRRHGRKIKNRICLNYFAATDGLEIERKDLFAANEYSFIFPLFGFGIYKKFIEANIGWLEKFKPNFVCGELKPAKYFVEVSPRQRAARSFFESLINLFWGDRIEAWLKRKQIARIERNPLTAKSGAYVVANDRNLIFLPDPQSPRVEEEWQKRTGRLTA
jgi:predicted nucleotidyltransferase